MTLYDRIAEKIIGRITLTLAESELLSKYASIEGDHLEIGCLWGGTAILAALSKIKAGVGGHIHTVDYMQGGFWVNGDPGANFEVPTLEKVQKNIEAFAVEDRITVIVGESNPLPDVIPSVVFIDGDHRFEGCMTDWLNVRKLNPDYVMFHDYKTGKHPGVERVVEQILDRDYAYQKIDLAGSLIVFERLNR